jgi:hypothetical protein
MILGAVVGSQSSPPPQQQLVYLGTPPLTGQPAYSPYGPAGGASPQYAGQPQYAGSPVASSPNAPQYPHGQAQPQQTPPSYTQMMPPQQQQQQQQQQGLPSYTAVQAARADEPRVAVAALPVGGGYGAQPASAPTYVPQQGGPMGYPPQAGGYPPQAYALQPQASAPTYVPTQQQQQAPPAGYNPAYAPGYAASAPPAPYGGPPAYDAPAPQAYGSAPPGYGARPSNDFVSVDKQ